MQELFSVIFTFFRKVGEVLAEFKVLVQAVEDGVLNSLEVALGQTLSVLVRVQDAIPVRNLQASEAGEQGRAIATLTRRLVFKRVLGVPIDGEFPAVDLDFKVFDRVGEFWLLAGNRTSNVIRFVLRSSVFKKKIKVYSLGYDRGGCLYEGRL